MSKKKSYGVSWQDFRYGIVLGSLSVILYVAVNILRMWYPSIELDIIQTVIYFMIILVALTVIIDYFLARKQSKR